MNNLQEEKEFFHFIAGEIRDLVSNQNKKITIARQENKEIHQKLLETYLNC